MRRLAVAGLLSLTLVPRYFARQTKDAGTNLFISELDTLIGRAALSLGDTHLIETETMPGLLKLWDQRQTLGAGNFDLSNAFLFVMEENPQAFFVSMAPHHRAFEEWIKELPDDPFVWYRNAPCQLETKRSELILQHTQIHAADASRLKDETLAKLSAIRCRQIQ